MRKLKYLITELRNSTDNKDINGVKDAEIVGYFNDAQLAIQEIIFNANPSADLFLATQEYDFVNQQQEYDLPDDIYADNALCAVEVRFGETNVNEGYVHVDRISIQERPLFFGYYCKNGQICFPYWNPGIEFSKFRVIYFKKLRRFDKSWATVTSVAGQVINLSNVDSDMQYIDDVISVVDSSNTQIAEGLTVSTYTLPTSLTAVGSLTGVAAGQSILMTNFATLECELPDACVTYMLDYCRQRLYVRQNYNDSNKQVMFTSAQQAGLISLFARKNKDGTNPPIFDIGYLGY